MNVHANAAGVGPGAEIESPYAWLRLVVALALGTIGSIGMWSFVVALPAVQGGLFGAPPRPSLPFPPPIIGFRLRRGGVGPVAPPCRVRLPGVVRALRLGRGSSL